MTVWVSASDLFDAQITDSLLHILAILKSKVSESSPLGAARAVPVSLGNLQELGGLLVGQRDDVEVLLYPRVGDGLGDDWVRTRSVGRLVAASINGSYRWCSQRSPIKR